MVELILYEGDCLKIIPKLEVEVDLVITDPPYGISNSEQFIWEEKQYRSVHEAWDKIEDLETFYSSWLELIIPILKNGASIYVTSSYHSLFSLKRAFDKTKLRFRNLLTWYKPNAIPTNNSYNGFYSFSCEYILFYTNGKIKTWNYDWMKHQNNGSPQRDLLIFNACSDTRWHHPTQKPLKLWKYLIQTCTIEGDMVLDPFLGSGTTMEACAILKRNCIGIEKDKNYCEIIKKRLKKYNNQSTLYDEVIKFNVDYSETT